MGCTGVDCEDIEDAQGKMKYKKLPKETVDNLLSSVCLFAIMLLHFSLYSHV